MAMLLLVGIPRLVGLLGLVGILSLVETLSLVGVGQPAGRDIRSDCTFLLRTDRPGRMDPEAGVPRAAFAAGLAVACLVHYNRQALARCQHADCGAESGTGRYNRKDPSQMVQEGCRTQSPIPSPRARRHAGKGGRPSWSFCSRVSRR